MKTLYESILDDEGTLIVRNKIPDNWLVILKMLLQHKASKEDVLKHLNSDEVQKDIKPIFKKFDSVYWDTEGYYDPDTDKDDIPEICLLFGDSIRATNNTPVVLSVTLVKKHIVIKINYKKLISSIKQNVVENKLIRFKKLLMSMGAKEYPTQKDLLWF